MNLLFTIIGRKFRFELKIVFVKNFFGIFLLGDWRFEKGIALSEKNHL